MTETLPELSEATELAVRSPEISTKETVITLAALGAMALVATALESGDLMHGWPWPLTTLGESGRHPLVGYIGAAIATRRRQFNNWWGIFLAGSLADLGTETAQAFLVDGSSHSFDWLDRSQIMGNLQDYVFAVGGTAYFFMRSRWDSLKSRRQDKPPYAELAMPEPAVEPLSSS